MGGSFFPPNSGGSDTPAGFPDYQIYAITGGTGAGEAGSPVGSIYAGLQALIANGGGTLYIADNTPMGGPVADQGIWLRNDGIAVPGFLDLADAKCRIVGQGTHSGQYVFERPGAARVQGGSSGDFFKPGIWVVGCEVPIDFTFIKNYTPEAQGISAPVRLGWDYVRKANFAIDALDVTNATRSGGSTVLTVDIADAEAWTVLTGSRDADDNVILTLTRPATVALTPWAIGSKIRVVTSDATFPSIDATVTGQSDVLNLTRATTTVTVTYVQSGATTATQAVTGGTIKSHGLIAGDYLALVSVSAEFPTCCQMRVTAATITTVTVFDPYGYSPRSASANVNNIGYIVKQNRGRQVASGVQFERCSFFGAANATDNFVNGPTIDMGGTSANDTCLLQCYMNGGLIFNWQDVPNNYDPDRTMCAIFANPGGGTLSGASFQAYNCQSQSGAVRWYPQQTEAHIYMDQWLQDSAGNALPTVSLVGGNVYASVRLDRIAQADANQYAIVIGAGYDQLKVQIGDVFTANPSPIFTSSIISGPTNVRSAFWSDINGAVSPWAQGWHTTWAGGLTTPHVNVNRAFGPVQARTANLMPAFGSWVGGGGQPATLPTGVTVAATGAAPDGSSTAIDFTCTASFDGSQIVVGAYPATLSASVGDYVVVGVWINSPATDTASLANLTLQSYAPGDVAFTGFKLDNASFIRVKRNVLTTGWQWCYKVAQVASITTGAYYLAFNAPTNAATKHYQFYAPTIVTAPASVGVNDVAEWAENLKHQPQYLAAGMSGTMENTKFIAHGGLGVSATLANTVGVGSGQLTLTGTGTTYIPVYAADGTTIQGWVAQLQATVNP